MNQNKAYLERKTWVGDRRGTRDRILKFSLLLTHRFVYYKVFWYLLPWLSHMHAKLPTNNSKAMHHYPWKCITTIPPFRSLITHDSIPINSLYTNDHSLANVRPVRSHNKLPHDLPHSHRLATAA